MLPGLIEVPREATHLRGNQWAVRPEGHLGTCGFSPVPWTVQYVTAGSAAQALQKTKKIYKTNTN